MQVNDAVLAGNNLVSCSSDTTLKVLHFKKIVLIFEEMIFLLTPSFFLRYGIPCLMVFAVELFDSILTMLLVLLLPRKILWDLGQQRCVHSYAVHTDSVWALASNSTFTHVYSGGRDLSVPVYKEPSFTIPGIPGIVQYEILNNRRHVLTKVPRIL
ncbi:hypothetical protein GW17_00014627 [Ensete ventricosum]|nr:hypothetical protein GW17_00014627 [Ensete ventricosum]